VSDLVAATEAAIAAAKHLTSMDKGAIETLLVLARKIDTEAVLREMALEWAEEHKQKPPSVDNVSIPTYLKFCESLGLTPAGRVKLGDKKPEAKGGTLSVLRDEAASKRKAAG
jgi:hypothetical protein